MNARLKNLRRIFLLLFLLSIAVLLYLFFFSNLFVNQAPGPVPPPDSNMDSVITFLVSVSSAVISLLGFLITTAVSVRRERREAREAEISLKHKEVELEKARLELEQLKKKTAKNRKR